MKKRNNFFRMMLFIIFSLFMLNSYSQEDTTNLFDMDLEALMNLEITTASKTAQTISEAPAIVTVITSKQIQEYGVLTLTELMTYVPGFTVADSYWKRQMVTARGVKMTLYNDKILMLINGIPAYDAAALEHYLDVIPITSVDKIEIIRGPGSTLYGTNAFSAVINIITKDGEKSTGFDAYLMGGSFATREVGFSVSDKFNNFSYHFGTTMKDNDGYRKYEVADEYTNTNFAPTHPFYSYVSRLPKKHTLVYEHDNHNYFANLKYKDFSLQSGYMYQKWAKFGPLPAIIFSNNGNTASGGRAYQDKFYVNLIFDKELSEKLSTKVTFHYDWMDKQSDIGNFGEAIYKKLLNIIDTTTPNDFYRFSGYLYQLEAQARYSFNQYANIIAGATYESRTTTHLADLYSDLDGYLLFEGSTRKLPFSIDDIGAYLQVNGKIWKLGYTAGIRMSVLGMNEKTYITPRVGLVYGFAENSSIKLLYGEAFRGAGPQEGFYKVPILIYGPDAVGGSLKPERIRTYEVAWDQTITNRYKIRLNGYYLNVFDIIQRRDATQEELNIIDPNMTATKIYDNLGEQEIMGLEAEVHAYPTDYLSFFANYSYKEGKIFEGDSTVSDYIPFMENHTFNGGFTLSIFNKRLSISPNYQYVGERKGTLISKPDSIFSVDAFGLLNVNVSYKASEKVTISLIARNITDEMYFYPEDVRRNIPVIPGGPGASAFVKLHYRFGVFKGKLKDYIEVKEE